MYCSTTIDFWRNSGMLFSQINENYLRLWQSELNNFKPPFTYSQKRGGVWGGVFDNFPSVLKISPSTFSLPNSFRIFPQNFQKFFVRFESSKIGTKNERLPLCRSRRSLGYSVFIDLRELSGDMLWKTLQKPFAYPQNGQRFGWRLQKIFRYFPSERKTALSVMGERWIIAVYL